MACCSDVNAAESRVLLLVSSDLEDELCLTALRELKVSWFICRDANQLVAEIRAGAGAVLLDEEALSEDSLTVLDAALAKQPPWSDLPLLVLTHCGSPKPRERIAAMFENTLLMETPTESAVLRNAVRVALRSRMRQYQLREQLLLADRQKKKLAELEQANQISEGAAERTHFLLACLDKDFNFLWVNRVYAAAGGRSPDFFVGKNHFDLYPNADNERLFRRVVESGEPCFCEGKSFEYPDHPERGVTYWDWSLMPIFDNANNEVIRLVLSLADVTSRVQAEQALARSRAEFQAMFHSLPDPVIISDPQRRIVMVNPAFEEVFGYEAGEAIGRTTEFLYAHVADFEAQGRLRYGRSSSPQPRDFYEMRYRRKDGSEFVAESVGDHVLDEQGRLIGFVSLHRDVTERTLAKQALRESDGRFRQIAENIEEVFFLVTPDWQEVLYISPAYEKVWGRSCESLYESARSWMEAIVEDDRAGVAAAVKQGIAGNLPKMFPAYRIHRPDGTERWIKARGWPIFDENGRIYRVAGIAEDVTERKQAEEALRQSHRQLQTIYGSMRDGLLVVDADTRRFLRTNPAMCRMLGYDERELLSMSVPDIHPLEKMPEILEQFDSVRDGEPKSFKSVPVVARDGRRMWMDISGRLATYNGKACGIACFHDISERIEMEEALQRAKEAAEAASIAKSQFLANTSHEFRTPMTAILGMMDLALDEDLSPTVRDYLETARYSATTFLDLINDLLDFSRIEAGRFELESTPFRLRETMEQVIKTLGVRAYEKGLELICDWSDEIPDHVVGDPLRLRQILINLVGNSIKFTPTGEVVVGMDGGVCKHGEVVIQFSVADTGIGIASEDRAKVFDPFFQADASMTRNHGGSGLGLAITVALVERMGGQIKLESQVGKGTTFRFTVRLGLQSPPCEATELPEALAEKIREMPVLIVAESVGARRVLSKRLARWSMQPQTASDFPTAQTKIRDARAAGCPFPLVLTECHTPHIDGLALARSIHAQTDSADAIIMMSSHRKCHSKPSGAAEADAVFIEKPVLPSSLLSAIAEVFGYAGRPVVSRSTSPRIPTGQANRTLRILLAEDSPANQKYLQHLLGRRGHQVLVTDDGQRALDILQDRDFDLVLMDLQMPRMDGLETTAAIRALPDPTKAALPIVALTAHALKAEADRCLAGGMDAYLSKPIDSRRLIELVEQLTGVSPPLTETAVDQDGGPQAEPVKTGASPTVADSPSEASVESFDFDQALQTCFGDSQLLQDMVQCFFEEADSLFEAMRRALEQRDAQQLGRHAHRLKNTVLFLAARPTAEAIRDLERIVKHGKLVGAEEALDLLAKQISLLREALTFHSRKLAWRVDRRVGD